MAWCRLGVEAVVEVVQGPALLPPSFNMEPLEVKHNVMSALEPTAAMATTEGGLWDRSDALGCKCSLKAGETQTICCIFPMFDGRQQPFWQIFNTNPVATRGTSLGSLEDSGLELKVFLFPLITPDPSRVSAFVSCVWAAALLFHRSQRLEKFMWSARRKKPQT